MDIRGYQTLDTGWGLGRIRAQEGRNLDSAVDPVPPDSTDLGIYDKKFPVHQGRGEVSTQTVEDFVERYEGGGAPTKLDGLDWNSSKG